MYSLNKCFSLMFELLSSFPIFLFGLVKFILCYLPERIPRIFEFCESSCYVSGTERLTVVFGSLLGPLRVWYLLCFGYWGVKNVLSLTSLDSDLKVKVICFSLWRWGHVEDPILILHTFEGCHLLFFALLRSDGKLESGEFDFRLGWADCRYIIHLQ